MILGRVAFGVLLGSALFMAWIQLFIFDPDDDEYSYLHVAATIIGLFEHVLFIALAIKYLIEKGVI